jgi:hypothetical protein
MAVNIPPTRAEQVTIFRLRSRHNRMRHNRMRHHLFHKYRIGATDQCSCNTGPMTTSHALQDCPLREALRKYIWPNGVNLQDQLYGDRADMQRTAEYIRRTGLTVKPSGRTSGQMVSTYRTNCTETEQICRGQQSTSDE